jgi:hypothetical protein
VLLLLAPAAFVLAAALLQVRKDALDDPPIGALLALALGSGALAALASAAPSEYQPVDMGLRAALGFLLVIGAARMPALTIAVAAGTIGALLIADQTSELVTCAGLVAAGLTVAPVAAGRWSPLLSGLAGGLIAQVVLRLEGDLPTGATAVAAALVSVPLVVAAVASAPKGARRVVGGVAFLVVGIGTASAGAALLAVLEVRPTIERGVEQATAGIEAIEGGDVETATARLEESRNHFGEAQDILEVPWLQPAAAVPVVAQNLRAVQTLTRSGAELSEEAVRALGDADPDNIRMSGGRIDLAVLDAIAAPIREVALDLSLAQDELADVDSPWLAPVVAEKRDDLAERVDRAAYDAETAAMGVKAARRLLGGDGPRRYFLAIQTPSELRGAGGFMGNWGEITAVDGELTLERVSRVTELNEATEPATRSLSGPEDYLGRYGRFGPAQHWGVTNMSPHFPSVATAISELFPQSAGQPVDGVISVDPLALGALLQLTGPVEVPNWPVPLDPFNAASVLLFEQYVEYEDDERIDFLGDATRAVWDRLMADTLPGPDTVGEALAPTVRARHLQLHSNHPEEQAFFERVGADGGVPVSVSDASRVVGDSLGIVAQNFGGNKIDWFLHRSYDYDVTIDPGSGRLRAELEIRLRNDAPSSGLPNYIIGPNGVRPPGQPMTSLGENLLDLSVFSPLRLEEVSIDGREISMTQEREIGRNVYSSLVRVPSQTVTTVRLTLTGLILDDDIPYTLTLWPQATVHPDEATVRVHLPPGWTAGDPEGFEPAGGVVAAADATLDGSPSATVSASVVVDQERVLAVTPRHHVP